MTDKAISPLRQRMIEDMTIRKLSPKTQHDYVQRVKNFTAFLGRSPDTASFEDVRRARARELLAVAKPKGEPASAAVDPGKPSCPCCGGRMIIIEVFERGATPRHRPTAPTSVIRIDTS